MPAYLSEPAEPATPQTLERKEERIVIKGVTWQSEPAYVGSVEGIYIFTAVLPDGYALAEGTSLPQITVTVQGEDPVVQELLARIAALPEAEAYLAEEPDVEAEDEYEAWMGELSAYAEEALAIWEAYEALTAAQQARIPQEALAKLTAWVELAEQLAESSQVMAAADEWTAIEGTSLEWRLAGSTLTIRGNGAMPDWDASTSKAAPWSSERESIKTIIIDSGVENIGNYAIDQCGNLESIEIADTVKSIGGSAFRSCRLLKSIKIPDGVTQISSTTFFGCNSLERIEIPDSVTSIGSIAFCGCTSLKNIEIPKGVTSIGGDVFRSCSSLSGVTFKEGGSIPTLASGCFNDCYFVKKKTKGIIVPSCSYLKAEGWEPYKDYVTLTEPHTLEHIPEKPATATEDGTKEYWKCSKCNTMFSDVDGTKIITEPVIIPATTEVTLTVELLLNGQGWRRQNVTAKRSDVADEVVVLNENPAGSGVYQGQIMKGGKYLPCLDGKNIGRWNTGTVSGNVSFTFNYVTVTYHRPDGVQGEVPSVESPCFCGINELKYEVDTTLPLTKPGYAQIGWSLTSDGDEVNKVTLNDGNGTIRQEPIELYPVFAPATVTINATNCTHNGATEVAASGDYTVTFTPNSGYDVPTGVTVKIGSTTLGSDKYTYNSATGELTIPREKITGNVIITVTAGQHEHDLRYEADAQGKRINQSCSRCRHSSNAGFTLQNATTVPCTYTGSELKPYIITRLSSWLGSLPSISYENNVNVGEATVTLSIGGKSVSITFEIVPKSLEDASVTAALLSDSYQYTGEAITPEVTVKDGDKTLTKDKDYTVAYADNTAVGTATVTVTGKGNYTGERKLTFTIQDKAPEVSVGDLNLSGGTVTLPSDIEDKVQKGEVEIYDSEGNKIILNEDGSLPVEPGTTIKIKYPGSDKETEIKIPSRPAAPASPDEGAIERDGTTITVPKPDDGKKYEFVLVEKGKDPDWSKANTTGVFTDTDPNKEYDIYMREAATESSFASEPVKIEIGTSGTIPTPTPGGDGKDDPGNKVEAGTPTADGKEVTYEGTCTEGYTPVITIGGKTYTPEITWNGDGTGTWTVTVPAPAAGDKPVVNFNTRTRKGLSIEPDKLSIYADDSANESAEKLAAYLRENCAVKIVYDNGSSDNVTNGADFTTQGSFAPRGGTYSYTVEADGETHTGAVTLTVSSLTATVTAPQAVTKNCKAGGYTAAEVSGWLPEMVTVTYTGDGYTAKTESRAVTWETASLGANFGETTGSKKIDGTVTLPNWATGSGAVSIGIMFADKTVLTDGQMTLSVPGWAYGAQAAPAPKGSVVVADTDQKYTYQYSADSGVSWVAAESLPKSKSGNIIPGAYLVKMTYTGKNYMGTKTASFTVAKKPLTAEKGTLAVENRNYDGTTNATLKTGGKPALSGVVGNDDVSLGGTLKAVFTDKGPKKDIPVTVTGFALTGGDAGYYQLVNTTLTLKATISKKDSGNNGGGNSGSNNGSGNNNGESGTGNNNNGGSSSGGNNGGSNNGSGNNSGGTGSGSTTGKDGTSAGKGNGSTTGKDGTTGGKGSTGTTGKDGTTGGKGSTGTTGKGGTTSGKGSTSTTGKDGTTARKDSDSTIAGKDGTAGGKAAQQSEGTAGQNTETGNTAAAGQDGGVQQTVQAAVEDGRTACGLCHICPTFLGICCYVWLAVMTAVLFAGAVVFVVLRRKREVVKA